MPEEVEIETNELQETIEELHEERREREEAEKRNAWTRYIALTTALLAVFAAVGALQSGALVNEAMMNQLKASDTWAEYQSARLKDHLYTIGANTLLDSGAKLASVDSDETKAPMGDAVTSSHAAARHDPEPSLKSRATPRETKRKVGGKGSERENAGDAKSGGEKKAHSWKALPAEKRLASYVAKEKDENEKQEGLRQKAEHYEEESKHEMHLHHSFAHAVALIQVAIALSAVAALTRMKMVWLFSLVAGVGGIWMFAQGFLAK